MTDRRQNQQRCRDRPTGIEELASPGDGRDGSGEEGGDGEVAGGNGERIQVNGSGEASARWRRMAGPIPHAVGLSGEVAFGGETL